jgi:hypothetical protein
MTGLLTIKEPPMNGRVIVRSVRAALALVLILSCCAASGQAPRKVPPGPTTARAADGAVVLDTYSFWRIHHQLQPPVMKTESGLKPMLLVQSWLNTESPAAPPDWLKPEFDDSGWYRGTAPGVIKSPWVSRISLRGKFTVTDPAQVQGLAVSLEYHGGVVVYVNGQEAFRRNLPAGPLGPDTVAEAYPKEAFETTEARPLAPERIEFAGPDRRIYGGNFSKKPTAESERRMGLWSREAESVALPANLLRQGVNVLEIEVVRSPYDPVVDEIKKAYRNWGQVALYGYQIYFCTCEICQVQLKATGPAGLVANVARPQGLQVWNLDPAAPLFQLDYGDPNEPLRPLALVGPRGGTVSGKVGVGSTQAIRGLHGTATELRSAEGTMPAAQVLVRYGFPWGREVTAEGMRHAPDPYPQNTELLGGVADVAPKEYPVRSANGAVAAVWVTVKIPAEARPGLYQGSVRVEAEGQPAVKVPVEVKVIDWLAPAPKDFATFVDTIECPDTLALEYHLEPWSEKHWEMIGRVMDFQGEIGTQTLYLPLLAHTNLGNEESLVRWIKKGENAYDYDFTNFDRYLDTAEKHLGQPRIVVLGVWEIYMLLSGELQHGGRNPTRDEMMTQNLQEQGAKIDQGPEVTVYDPATRKTATVSLPLLGDPASKGLWEPLLKQVQARLRKRGLDQAVMFGINSDAWARKGQVAFFNDILPGTPWVIESHGGAPAGQLLYGLVKVGFQDRVWNVSFADENNKDGTGRQETATLKNAKDGRMYGWREPELIAMFERAGLSSYPTTRWRFYVEANITGAQRGVGRIATDGWPVLKNKNGQRQAFSWSRFPESNWRNLCLLNYLLAPGPDGPATTTRYEAFREGLQEAEARIFIEKALLDETQAAKLGPDLVQRCRATLDGRISFMWRAMSNLQMIGEGFDAMAQYATGWRWAPGPYGQAWFIGSGWQQRTEALYALAGEVQKKITPGR